MTVAVGSPVPQFTAPTAQGQFDLQAQAGKILVLYFYPKDSTPGCTTEGENFRDAMSDFEKAGATVLGISRDSVKSHQNFIEKKGFNFDLISDSDESVCKLFDVIKTKNMYGKQVLGIERSTFVIDRKGVLVKEWRGVKVPGHVQSVLEFVQSLN